MAVSESTAAFLLGIGHGTDQVGDIVKGIGIPVCLFCCGGTSIVAVDTNHGMISFFHIRGDVVGHDIFDTRVTCSDDGATVENVPKGDVVL